MPCALALGLLTVAGAQQRGKANSSAKPDRNQHLVVITAVPKHGGEQEPIGQGAVTVQQNGNDDEVRGWQAANAETTVDLAVIIDEDTRNIDDQLNDVRTFIKELPPNVRVGLGYMSAGAIQFAQSAFTPDRNLILLKLRRPSGDANASPSPYSSVQYLMQRWHPRPGQVHEMLVISDGVEHVGGNDTSNITLKKAVADTLQDGVVVYAIAVTSAPGADNGNGGPAAFGASPIGMGGVPDPGIIPGLPADSASNGGMNLSKLTEATGGMTYAGTSGRGSRFTPFLDDVLQRLGHQYLLTFESARARPGVASIKIDIHAPDDKVTSPKQIFVSR